MLVWMLIAKHWSMRGVHSVRLELWVTAKYQVMALPVAASLPDSYRILASVL